MATPFDGLYQLPIELRQFLSNLATGVDSSEITDGSVTAPKLAAGAVIFSKTKQFISTEQTGTGSEQTIAHGLGATPTKVLIIPTELPADLTAGYDSASGTHTTTNVLCTVTPSCKYMVLAWV